MEDCFSIILGKPVIFFVAKAGEGFSPATTIIDAPKEASDSSWTDIRDGGAII